MFRIVLTKYVPDIGVIYIDSLMRAFSSYQGAINMINKLVESSIEGFQEIYKDDENTTFVGEFSSDPDKHYAVIKKISMVNGQKSDLAVQLYDVFEIEETEDGFKYRDDFYIKSTKDESSDFEYYTVYLNHSSISFKEDFAEALMFIDNFIHSHTICKAINNNINITLV